MNKGLWAFLEPSLISKILSYTRCLFLVPRDVSPRKMFIPHSSRYLVMRNVYSSLFRMPYHARCIFLVLWGTSPSKLFILCSPRCFTSRDAYSLLFEMPIMGDVYSLLFEIPHHESFLFLTLWEASPYEKILSYLAIRPRPSEARF